MRIVRRLAILGTGVLATLVTAHPAHAATPLPTPGTPVATNVTTTSASFSWTPSSGPVADYTIQTIDVVGRPWRVLATTSETTYTHTNLNPDSVYTYRVIANPTAGSDHTASSATPHLWVRTRPLPDSVPPTEPGVPRAFPVSTVSATLTFGFSTDNNRVDAYWAQRQVDGVWTDWATNNITTVYLRDLAPGTTYTVAVVAVDANGNRSARSDPLTFTTRALEPAPTCRVQLLPLGQHYQVNVTIENMTAATIVESWTLTFTFPAGQTILYSNSVTITRDGTVGTATPHSYLARIDPGGTRPFGFFATNTAGSPLPSGFTLNSTAGVFPCTIA
ncbi:fibronectin type III domain-containing protein [Micromonospora sp. CPCC 206061]|uniref:fibronectin type III domain-containing protein n=1 Tax=Micromonospora sp. CPCC 206061 TaxID=3122410 RepID=UPI002FF134AA